MRLFLSEVNLASIAIAIVQLAKAIASLGHLPVQPLPEGQAAGNVQYWRQPPKASQTAREISNRSSASITIALAIDDVHLLHQHVMRQIGIALLHYRIVQ